MKKMMSSSLPAAVSTAPTGGLTKKLFWIVFAIDSIVLTLMFFSILAGSFTNAAPQVGDKLFAFLLLPLGLGIPICLFIFGNDLVARRLALLFALAPIPCVIAYGSYQDYLDAKRMSRSSEVSVEAASDVRKPMADALKQGDADLLKK